MEMFPLAINYGKSTDKLLYRFPGELTRLISRALLQGAQIALIYFDIPAPLCDKELGIEEKIRSISAGLLPEHSLLAVQNLGGNDYCLYCSLVADNGLIEEACRSLTNEIGGQLASGLSAGRAARNIRTGYALIGSHMQLALEQAIIAGIEQARNMARGQFDPSRLKQERELSGLIKNKSFRIALQPIVNLTTGAIYGYEALTRLPEDNSFASPLDLFGFAAEAGLLYPLEQVTREQALHMLSRLAPGQRMFLNITPQIINAPAFATGQTRRIIEKYNRLPEQIVFEITEGTVIEDIEAFRHTIDHYRSQGYRIAIDDFGAGYSNLGLIAELQPDFIKLDMSLVRNVHQKPAYRAIIEAMVTYAGKARSLIVAEGIEDRQQLIALAQMGVRFGQGFYLAEPAFQPPPLTPAAAETLKAIGRQQLAERKVGHEIGQLATRVGSFEDTVLTREVFAAFEGDRERQGVVITSKEQPVGLLMREKLYGKLATRYGYSLYMGRPVTAVMDADPLVVTADMTLELASQLAMSRSYDKIYDFLIVTDGQSYQGVVSVQTILNAITQKQLELARMSNPLTGLPGNQVIQAELDACLNSERDFALIYADLDDFKGYNDYYGFEQGDEVLKFTARILLEGMAGAGGKGDFLGQIGGDDFIIITVPERVEAICREIIRLFDRQIPGLYKPEDRERGYIEVCDRQHQLRRFPLLTISLGIVDNKHRAFRSYLELAAVAAEVKQLAKRTPGSCFAVIGEHFDRLPTDPQ
jgi:diguanylate cyclase (GGDEF)-like protein